MASSVKLGCLALRRVHACAILAVALALSGCGGIAAVGSTVASGAEAVGTVVKDAIREEDKEKKTLEDKPAEPK